MSLYTPAPAAFNSRMAYAEHATRQDYVLCISTYIIILSLHPLYIITVLFYLYTCFRLVRFAKQNSFFPEDIDRSTIPPRTYFMKYAPSKNTWWIIRKLFANNDFKTWSFYFYNIIICGEKFDTIHKTPRKMHLLHEYYHCGRGEIIIFIYTAHAAFLFLQMPITPRIDVYTYMMPIICVVYGLFLILLSGHIMRRREFITDYRAYHHSPDEYLEWLVSQQENAGFNKDSRNKSFWRIFNWHPSWEQRIDFVQNQFSITWKDQAYTLSTALLTGFFAGLVFFVLFSRLNLMTQTISEQNLIISLSVAHLYLLFICWLVASSAKNNNLSFILPHMSMYFAGLSIFLFVLAYFEAPFHTTVHFWHQIYPLFAGLTWILTSTLLLLMPFTKNSAVWPLTFYLTIVYFIPLTFFAYLGLYPVGFISPNDLQPSYKNFYVVFACVAGILFAVFSTILVLFLETLRRALVWTIRFPTRFLRRHHSG